ncbi:MAG: tRNA lysidine(34) synthetase TilS [Zoogloeaceae bacterium]|nr:tRNA lysidine(34) synthetase TilS [Zoogloeaceae bacterium]
MAGTRNKPSPESPPDLLERVRTALSGAGVVAGQRVGLALSGGVDSVVLLHALHRLAEEFGYLLSAIHVHHGLSPHADDWLAACTAHCGRLAIPFSAHRVTVHRGGSQGLEAAARRARFAVLDAQPVDWLALGHHMDDQAETVLFRLLRGAGVRGAAAMQGVERRTGAPARLRPLLAVRRPEIEAWARHESLSWVNDESNRDLRYARNALRHRWLPAVSAEFPGAVAALARAANHFREADELLDERAAEDARACGRDSGSWDLPRFLNLSAPRQRNLLRSALQHRGAEAPSSDRLGEALRQLTSAGERADLHFPLGDLALCAYRGQVWLEPVVATKAQSWPVSFARPAAGEGGMSVPWVPGPVQFFPAKGEGIAALALAGQTCVLTGRWPGLTLRAQAGRPRRRFKNLCQEAGVPDWWRERLPILRVGGEAAWIGGLGVAAEFACPPGEPGWLPVWHDAGWPRG